MANSVTRFGTAIATTAALHESDAAPATITRRMPPVRKLLNVLTAVPRTEACAISLCKNELQLNLLCLEVEVRYYTEIIPCKR